MKSRKTESFEFDSPALGTGKMRVEVTGGCPCGGRFQAGYVRHAASRQEEPSVMHTLPLCQKFVDLDVPDYLAYVRSN